MRYKQIVDMARQAGAWPELSETPVKDVAFLTRFAALVFEQGKQEGMKQEHALWKLARLGQEIEAQPAQEQQYEYLIDDLTEWKQYVEVDSAPYGLREHVIKVLLAHGIKEKNHD